MKYIVFDGEYYLTLKEISKDFFQAIKFRNKRAALNAAMRHLKDNNHKWVLLEVSKVNDENILEYFHKEKNILGDADFLIPVDFISDRYFEKNFVFDEKKYLDELDYYKKNKKFKNNVIINRNCIITDNYYTYFIAKDLGLKEVPCIFNYDFFQYLKPNIEKEKQNKLLIRKKIFENSNGKCLFCNKYLQIDDFYDINTYMTIDHIFPKSKGGKDDINNYQGLCRECNIKKGNLILSSKFGGYLYEKV